MSMHTCGGGLRSSSSQLREGCRCHHSHQTEIGYEKIHCQWSQVGEAQIRGVHDAATSKQIFGTAKNKACFVMRLEDQKILRPPGVEPGTHAWKASMLTATPRTLCLTVEVKATNQFAKFLVYQPFFLQRREGSLLIFHDLV